MMDLVTLIQMAFVAFLAWGGVLSLLYFARGKTWNFRARSMRVFSYAAANDFETGYRRMLSRRDAVAAAHPASIA